MKLTRRVESAPSRPSARRETLTWNSLRPWPASSGDCFLLCLAPFYAHRHFSYLSINIEKSVTPTQYHVPRRTPTHPIDKRGTEAPKCTHRHHEPTGYRPENTFPPGFRPRHGCARRTSTHHNAPRRTRPTGVAPKRRHRHTATTIPPAISRKTGAHHVSGLLMAAQDAPRRATTHPNAPDRLAFRQSASTRTPPQPSRRLRAGKHVPARLPASSWRRKTHLDAP